MQALGRMKTELGAAGREDTSRSKLGAWAICTSLRALFLHVLDLIVADLAVEGVYAGSEGGAGIGGRGQ